MYLTHPSTRRSGLSPATRDRRAVVAMTSSHAIELVADTGAEGGVYAKQPAFNGPVIFRRT